MMLTLPLLAFENLSVATSILSPELLNFHRKDLAGGSDSISQIMSTLSPRDAPITMILSYLHVGASEKS